HGLRDALADSRHPRVEGRVRGDRLLGANLLERLRAERELLALRQQDEGFAAGDGIRVAAGERQRRGEEQHSEAFHGGMTSSDGSFHRCDQCLKCRLPVKIIAMPRSSAAAMTSASRMAPPGWMAAVAPASAA